MNEFIQKTSNLILDKLVFYKVEFYGVKKEISNTSITSPSSNKDNQFIYTEFYLNGECLINDKKQMMIYSYKFQDNVENIDSPSQKLKFIDI